MTMTRRTGRPPKRGATTPRSQRSTATPGNRPLRGRRSCGHMAHQHATKLGGNNALGHGRSHGRGAGHRSSPKHGSDARRMRFGRAPKPRVLPTGAFRRGMGALFARARRARAQRGARLRRHRRAALWSPADAPSSYSVPRCSMRMRAVATRCRHTLSRLPRSLRRGRHGGRRQACRRGPRSGEHFAGTAGVSRPIGEVLSARRGTSPR